MSNIYDPKGENGIFDKIERNTDNAVREFSKGSEERLNKFFGDTTSLTSQAAGELTNVAISSTQYNEFITETKKLDKGKKDVGLGDSTRTGIFKQWLNNSYAQNHYKNSPSPVGKLFNARINQKGKDEDIKTFFEKNPQAKNRYRELFSDTTNTPPDIFEKKSFN
ncbi:MAG: hypothetical protein LBU27_03895 [Candidatus Peribacteria bacterium]|jgi:hypothetical protein|nr:hypothetical protein [Candidatus Peribacteria bacterium]